MSNIVGFIISIILTIGITAGSKIFKDKIKIKDNIKTLIIGVIYGALSIGSSFLSLKTELGNSISINSSVVLMGGALFGWKVGLISGLMSGFERIFSINYGFVAASRFSTVFVFVCAGVLSFLFNKLINENNKFKWYFVFIECLIVESISVLLLFLFNISTLDVAYEIAKDTILYSFIFNFLVVGLSLVPIILLRHEKREVKNPLSIQTKVQTKLALTIFVGFFIVLFISTGILTNMYNESTSMTIRNQISDIKSNLTSDVNNAIESNAKTALINCKTSAVLFNPNQEILKSISTLRGFSNISIINKDGTILVSTDEYINSLSNISEFGCISFPGGVGMVVNTEFKYFSEKNGYYQFRAEQYTSSKDDAYVIFELDIASYQKLIDKSLAKGLAERHLGDDGFIIVIDSVNEVVSTPIEIEYEAISIDSNKKDSLLTVYFLQIEYYCYYSEFAGYKIIGLMNKATTDINKNISTYITSFATILVFCLLYFVIYLSIKKEIIKPLFNVNESLDKICGGELDEKVCEDTSYELKTLSDDINHTVESLKDYIGREAKMLQKELNFAKGIQLSALPHEFPKHDRFELYALMETAKEVGGDFYDFYFVDPDHFCILIADVSGKGVPAALFMMQSKTIIKSYIEAKIPLEDAFNMANKKLCELNSAGMFVTVWCGIIDLRTGVLDYINAGHNKPLIANNGKYEFLDCKAGFVFGVMDLVKYHLQSVKLNPGDQIYLYTDGVNEAENLQKELFGNDRMVDTANILNNISSKDFCEDMISKVKEYVDVAEQSDDITQLHFKYLGNK